MNFQFASTDGADQRDTSVPAAAFALLTELKAGATVHDACSAMIENGVFDKDDLSGWIAIVTEWFQLWSELGWLTQCEKK